MGSFMPPFDTGIEQLTPTALQAITSVFSGGASPAVSNRITTSTTQSYAYTAFKKTQHFKRDVEPTEVQLRNFDCIRELGDKVQKEEKQNRRWRLIEIKYMRYISQEKFRTCSSNSSSASASCSSSSASTSCSLSSLPQHVSTTRCDSKRLSSSVNQQQRNDSADTEHNKNEVQVTECSKTNDERTEQNSFFEDFKKMEQKVMECRNLLLAHVAKFRNAKADQHNMLMQEATSCSRISSPADTRDLLLVSPAASRTESTHSVPDTCANGLSDQRIKNMQETDAGYDGENSMYQCFVKLNRLDTPNAKRKHPAKKKYKLGSKHSKKKKLLLDPDMFECPYCHEAVLKEDKLTHEQNHVEERPFSCTYCKKRFKQIQHKLNHERIHTGVKPYSCQYCMKKFVQLTHKKVHERRHTGEKPYPCQFCDERFKQLTNKRDHERSAHSFVPFKPQAAIKQEIE